MAHPSLRFHRPFQAFVFAIGRAKGDGIEYYYEELGSDEVSWTSDLRKAWVIERPDWATKYATRAERVKHYEAIAAQLKEIFRSKTRAEWMERLEREDVPFAPELGVQEIEHDPQVKHLGTIYSLSHKTLGEVRAAHRPAKVDGSREIDFRPPPGLGEHTEEILAELREKGVL